MSTYAIPSTTTTTTTITTTTSTAAPTYTVSTTHAPEMTDAELEAFLQQHPLPKSPMANQAFLKANVDLRLQGYQDLMENGAVLIWTAEKSSSLFHKCVKEDPSSKEFKKVPWDTVKIYSLENDLNDVHFDSVFFNQVNTFLKESGYTCQCSLRPQLNGREGLMAIQLTLDPVFRFTNGF